MRGLKTLTSILAAITLTALGTGAAQAEETHIIQPTTQQTITIDGTTADRPFKAVQLAGYEQAQTTGDTIDAITVKTTDTVRTPVENATKKTGWKDTTRDPMEWVAATLTESDRNTHAGTLRDFVTALAVDKTIENSGIAFTGSTTPALAPGIYLILDQSESGASLPMLVGTTVEGKNTKDGTLGRVALKTTGVEAPHKTAKDGNGEEKTEIQAKVGDIIRYTVTQTVPSTVGYDRYYLALKDTMGDGLTFQSLDSVSLDGKTADRNLYHETHDAHGLTVLFGSTEGDIHAAEATIKDGTVISISYNARINTSAVIGQDGNPNAVKVEYSDNPADWTHHGTTPGDGTVKVYVGGFTLHKVGEDGKPIDGAVFNVTDKGSDTPLRFTLMDGTYMYDPDNGTVTDLPAGVLKVGGLNGEYTVREISGPYGNSLMPKFSVTVHADKNGSASTVTRDRILDLSSNLSDGTIQVRNIRNITQLPTTGLAGIGLWATAVLILAGAGLALTRRRSAK